MNFFEAQDRSRRNTRHLVLLYIAATLVIVLLVTAVVAVIFSQSTGVGYGGAIGSGWLATNLPLLGTTAAATAAFIGLASVYRIAGLSAGGGRVALDVGGAPIAANVADPLRRRLLNVVEEMAIASGVPAPDVYVLEEEAGINAFAAGYSTDDAAIAVTRGTLELLNRDELQGVVAHEFSHVLNGDMRLNIRLIGVLFGILAIGIVGRMILRSARYGGIRRSGNKKGGAAAVLALGAALYMIGSVGVFMARLIKAAVSRQREFLADASAIQFTRQTEGIGGALKKIGGYQQGSYLRATESEEISHMLFALGARGFAGLFATHPPLIDRIRAIDPAFEPDSIETIAIPDIDRMATEAAAEVAGIAAFDTTASLEPGHWLDYAGNPAPAHIAFAGELRRSITDLLVSAVHSPDQSVMLAIALVLSAEDRERQWQLTSLKSKLGEARSRRIAALYDEYTALGPRFRLPLLDLAFPALKRRPAGQIEFLIDLINHLIVIDGSIDIHEYSVARLIESQLGGVLRAQQAVSGKQRLSTGETGLRAARTLLAVLAWHGQDSEDARTEAYRHGIAQLPAAAASPGLPSYPADWVRACDAALRELNLLDGRSKRELLDALIATVRYDSGVTVAESEMIRAFAAVLHCPLPPLLADL